MGPAANFIACCQAIYNLKNATCFYEEPRTSSLPKWQEGLVCSVFFQGEVCLSTVTCSCASLEHAADRPSCFAARLQHAPPRNLCRERGASQISAGSPRRFMSRSSSGGSLILSKTAQLWFSSSVGISVGMSFTFFSLGYS